MGVGQLIVFIKEAAKRLVVIMLAVILMMIVASRNVEFELEKAAIEAETQVEESINLP